MQTQYPHKIHRKTTANITVIRKATAASLKDFKNNFSNLQGTHLNSRNKTSNSSHNNSQLFITQPVHTNNKTCHSSSNRLLISIIILTIIRTRILNIGNLKFKGRLSTRGTGLSIDMRNKYR